MINIMIEKKIKLAEELNYDYDFLKIMIKSLKFK